MISWIQAHGGLVGVIVAVVVITNILLSALASVLKALSVNTPDWIATVVAALSKVTDWISANIQHAPVDPVAKKTKG